MGIAFRIDTKHLMQGNLRINLILRGFTWLSSNNTIRERSSIKHINRYNTCIYIIYALKFATINKLTS